VNYRHAYHAGNFADVVKHVALVAILLHLRKKEKPFRVIDTHAGAGLYDLGGDAAPKESQNFRILPAPLCLRRFPPISISCAVPRLVIILVRRCWRRSCCARTTG